MGICRVKKTTDYTVMSNYHLKDKNLSLKAIGLLSKVLSLPDGWDYSISGLVSICKENETAIKSALKELKNYGYLVVEKIAPNNKNNGKWEYIYTFYEIPKDIEILDTEILDTENLPLENIPLNKVNNKSNTKQLNSNILYNNKLLYNDVKSSTENNSFLQSSKKSKQSRYDKYISLIDDFMFNNIITDDTEIKQLLTQHLNMLIEMNNESNRQLYSNQYKGILNKFTELIREKIKGGKINKQKFIKNSIQQSITKNWVNFFDIKEDNYNGNKKLINNNLGESFGYIYDYNLTEEEKKIDYSKKF